MSERTHVPWTSISLLPALTFASVSHLQHMVIRHCLSHVLTLYWAVCFIGHLLPGCRFVASYFFSENIFPACHSSLYFHCSFFETLLSTCFALGPRGPLRIPSSFLQPGPLCFVYGFPFSWCFILNNVIHFLFVCEAP